MPEKILFFCIILFASSLNNLLIPFLIYYKKYGFFRKRNKDFIGCNAWGIIMDGILVGLMNITAFNLIYDLKSNLFIDDIKLSIFIGFLSMVATHIWMTVRRWKIWIMPTPGRFNSAGYWHMISMTIQLSFLYYPLILIGENSSLLQLEITIFSLMAGVLLSILFLLSLYFSRTGLKIWKLNLSNQPW